MKFFIYACSNLLKLTYFLRRRLSESIHLTSTSSTRNALLRLGCSFDSQIIVVNCVMFNPNSNFSLIPERHSINLLSEHKFSILIVS